MTPRVSVVMGVRDGAPWVGEAVRSVLVQTLGDLELIVVDDGSTDATPDVLAAIEDPRLRVERQAPEGLTRALNRALALARADLVARLDADDVGLPQRLARQHAFLAAHAAMGLLGTAAREVDAAGREVRVLRPPEDDAALRRLLIRRNPFVHSSVMVRRALLERVGGYDARLAVAQDYDLWMRMAAVTRLATECRVRWRAVRAGTYPWWCAVFAVRPALALALPTLARRALRRRAHRDRPRSRSGKV